jgi:S1-C subfamily serine protease
MISSIGSLENSVLASDMRPSLPLLCLCYVVLACPGSAADDRALLEAALGTVTSIDLQRHAQFLADDALEGRAAGSRGGHAAARYLLQRLRESGLAPGAGDHFTQTFNDNYKNLLALLEGSDDQLRDELILVSAHFDHVGYGTRRNSNGPIGNIHNGADDNASGIAVLLEVIEAFMQSGYQPRRSILFAFWDGEENGLLGSRHWIRNPTMPLARLGLVLNIDMVGRLRDDRLEIIGSRVGYGLRKHLASRQLPEHMWLDFTWELKENSDHWSFMEQGIPAVCLHTGIHEDYHRPSDDVEKLNIEGIQQVTRALLIQLCHIADLDQTVPFRSAGRYETPDTQRRIEKPLAAIPPRLGLWWRTLPGPPTTLVVTRVEAGKAAARAGLRRGDKILTIDGQSISGTKHLTSATQWAQSQLELGVLRSSAETQTERATKTALDQPAATNPASHSPSGQQPETVVVVLDGEPVRLGLSWRGDEAEPETVYVTRVVPNSPAFKAGLQVHDRIHALDGVALAGQDDFLRRAQKALTREHGRLMLTLESRGRIHDIEIVLKASWTEQGHGDRSL